MPFSKHQVIQRIAKFRLGLFPRPPERGESVHSNLQAWQKYKEKIRYTAAWYFIAISMVTMQLAAPNFSLSGNLADATLQSSDLFRSIIEAMRSHLKLSSTSGATTVKVLVFIAFLRLAQYSIETRDSLSNNEHLDMLASGRRRKRDLFLPWIKGVEFYSKHCPTSQLLLACSTCSDGLNCNSQPLGSDYGSARRAWGRIIGRLDKDILYDLLHATNRCRGVALAERVIFGVTIVALSAYIFARMIEAIRPDLHLQANYIVLAEIICTVALLILFKFWHPVADGGTGGAWHDFRQTVNRIMESESLKKARKQLLCIEYSNRSKYALNGRFYSSKGGISELTLEKEYRTVQALIAHMDAVVYRKLTFFLDRSINNDKKAATYVGASLASLLAFYYAMQTDKTSFRICIFLPSEDRTTLIPWKWESTPGASFSGLPSFGDKSPSSIDNRFDIEGDSLVAEAWRTQQFICTEKPPMFYPKQRDHLKSLAAMPLICDTELIELGSNVGFSICNPIGVLCIDSSKNAFLSMGQIKHQMYIKPFAVRITYELLRSAIAHWDSKEEVGNVSEKPFVTPSVLL